MGPYKTHDVIRLLLMKARPEITKYFRVDSCIASCAIALDVLDYFGVPTVTLPVKTWLFNERFAARIERGEPWPQGDTIKRWVKEDGSYSVGIGFGAGGSDKWPGHLNLLSENKYLIDLSIDQANRPAYSMSFRPFCVEVGEDFHRGVPRVFKYNKCVIRIDSMPLNIGYLTTPDWLFKERRKPISEAIIQAIKEHL